MDGPAGSLEIPGLEWHSTPSSGGLGKSPAPYSKPQGNARGALQVSEGRGRGEISVHAQANRHDGITGDFLLRHFHERHGTGSMENSHDASGKLCSTADRLGLQKSWPSTRASGGESSRLADEQMRPSLLIPFGNRSNACYMNSLVQVFLWILDRDHGLCQELGRCTQFFALLQQHSHQHIKYLSQDMLWCMLTSGWKDSQRQHDVCEFAAYMCKLHKITMVQGEWEARTYINGVGQPGDAGYTTQPLLLSLPNRPPGLDDPVQVQSMVDLWHAHEAVHAFTALPQFSFCKWQDFELTKGECLNSIPWSRSTKTFSFRSSWTPFSGSGPSDITA